MRITGFPRFALAFFVLLSTIPSFVACDLTALLSDDECQSDSDCDDDEECDDGACVECTSDSDCDDDEECDDGDCDPISREGEGELGEGEGEFGEGEGEGEFGEGEGEGEFGEGEGEGEGEGFVGGALRLVAGTNAREGRLEIQFNGVFGTICDDGFDVQEAIVACRQLGFSGGTGVQGGGFPNGDASLNIFLDGVSCSGAELELVDCSHNPIGSHDCSHSEDVGVICEGEGETGEGEGESEGEGAFDVGPLRLAGGTTGNDGRLELQVNGVFGTICDDGFGPEEAVVACRELGFSTGTTQAGPVGSESLTIWLDDVVCIGTESRLIDCTNSGIGVENCDHSEDVGVICE
jgi:hypothetical protein